MFQRITVMCIVVFSLLACVTPQGCFADAVEVLEQAKAYKNSGNQQLAQQTYNTVAASYPGSGYALTAKSEITIMSISAKTDSQVQAEIDGLKAEFSGNANLPAALCNIAAGYAWAGRYQQGDALYQQIIQDYPASGTVAKAQIGAARINALSLIKSGDYTTAATEVQRLLTGFSGSEYLPAALYHIARKYQWIREFDQAKGLLQQVIQLDPQGPEVGRAAFDIEQIEVLLLLKAGEFAQAGAKIEQFRQTFSANMGLPVALYHLAQEYERQARYENASNLYQQVSTQYPDNFTGQRSQFDYPRTAVLSLIQGGDYTAAGDEAGKFKANFSSNPAFTKAMFNIGEEYYKKAVFSDPNAPAAEADGLYEKAVSAWQTVLQDSKAYSFTRIACYLAGRCFYRLGDYENAITSCQRAASDWPDYEHACDALLIAGRSCEKLIDSGKVSETQALPQIKAAYTQIMENYPACEAARYAQRWLARNNAE